MIKIGGKHMLWHILKIYSFYDINEFRAPQKIDTDLEEVRFKL